MNAYEARQEERRQRYLERAAAADQEATARFNSPANRTLRDMGGEPIKIGHHSEKRHRRLFEKADNDMRKGCEAMDLAKHYRAKADGVGEGGISSDDPDALTKLRERLKELEDRQAKMKRVNAQYKKGGAAAIEGLTPEQAQALEARIQKGYSWDRRPYACYTIKNNNANIRRIRQRIESLERLAQRAEAPAPEPTEGEGWAIEDHPEENRLWVTFDAKPPETIRHELRGLGFKWSPTRTAWIRNLNTATYARQRITALLAANRKEA